MNVGQTIKIARKDKRLTQDELAAAVNLSRNYISLIESGKREPSIDALMSISRHLSLDEHKLIAKLEVIKAIKRYVDVDKLIRLLEDVD